TRCGTMACGMTGSNPERVVAALRSSPGRPLCDDCIALLAGIKNRVAVNPIATALGLTTDFARDRGTCGRCSERKLVTWARPMQRPHP
ncbi:MAG: hypothetical protein KJZ68_13485, partial [Phycisphaerales bacterium]|nr:hypothetical protein [Phycisphaerales bacterium]